MINLIKVIVGFLNPTQSADYIQASNQARMTPFKKMTWKAQTDKRDLTGRLVISPEGSTHMIVDGYYTSREMSGGKFDFTPGQLKRFVGKPDEVALGKEGFRCDLYSRHRIDVIVASPEYQQAQEKRRLVAEKARVTRERNAPERERKAKEEAERLAAQRAAERADFDGKVFLGKFTCNKGYLLMGTFAKNEASATVLFEQWLSSPEGKSFAKDCFDDVTDDYKEYLKDYREEYRYDIRNYGTSDLIEPVKPLLTDYAIILSEVKEATSELEADKFEIEEVIEVADKIEGYHFDIHSRHE